MNRYQLLKDNEDTIYLFVKAGILSYKVLRDMQIYESYCELQDDVSYNQIKYILLGEQYDLSEHSIELIIYNMQRKIT